LRSRFARQGGSVRVNKSFPVPEAAMTEPESRVPAALASLVRHQFSRRQNCAIINRNKERI